MKKQILAMGGGGFSMEPDNLALDRFLLSLSDKERPKVCFIGTASGDAESYIERFYTSMKALNCEPSHLALYRAPEGSLRDFVLDKDIIYVGGGNTRNLLALWKEWKLDEYLVQAYENGTVLAGISAGSICWFEEGVTDSIPGKLSSLKCLGLLNGSNCPHYDGESERRDSYHKLLSQGMKSGVACDDGVAGYYVDGKLVEFFSSRESASAYKVSFGNGKATETKVIPTYLAL
jgi:dipeptidase E